MIVLFVIHQEPNHRGMEPTGITRQTNLEVQEVQLDELYVDLNDYRAKNGLESVKRNPVLDEAAEAKCGDMVAKNYWSHSDGTKSFEHFTREKIEAKRYGENLARGFSTDEQITQAWINSQTHRENMVGDFTDVGFAHCGIVVVEVFVKL